MNLFTTISHSQLQCTAFTQTGLYLCAADLVLADLYPAQVYNCSRGRRVSVNYVITGVNSRCNYIFFLNLVQICYLLSITIHTGRTDKHIIP